MYVLFSTWQGPPGKDGLPGHPGQRGETVSNCNILYERYRPHVELKPSMI